MPNLFAHTLLTAHRPNVNRKETVHIFLLLQIKTTIYFLLPNYCKSQHLYYFNCLAYGRMPMVPKVMYFAYGDYGHVARAYRA